MCNEKKGKIILLYADNIVETRPISNMPVTETLHAFLKQDSDVFSLVNLSQEEIYKKICDLKPDYICVEIRSTEHMDKVFELLENYKKVSNCKIIVFGFFVSSWADYLCENGDKCNCIDYVMKGEPERGIKKIINGEIVNTSNHPMLVERMIFDSLDELPRQEFVGKTDLNIMISRGCLNNCNFCYERQYYGKYRYRSVKNVVDELSDFCKQCEKKPWVYFSDLDFLAISDVNSEWIDDFCQSVLSKNINFNFTMQTRSTRIKRDMISKLKSIGLQGVALGIESGSERVLADYNKKSCVEENEAAIATLRGLGIPYKIHFIMYDPSTRLDDIRAGLNFFKRIGFPAGAYVSHPPVSLLDKLRLVRGTVLYEKYMKLEGFEYSAQNYYVTYDFLHSETRDYYNFIEKWRHDTKDFLSNYYMVLDILLNTDKPSNLLFVSMIGNKFKEIDLEMMIDLLDNENKNEVYERYLTKVDRLHNRLYKNKSLSQYFESEHKHTVRGWHINYEKYI